MSIPADKPADLTTTGRYVVLVCAILGWFCCGFHMANTSLAMRPAAIDLLARNGELDKGEYARLSKVPEEERGTTFTSDERAKFDDWNGRVGSWFSWLTTAFLFGGASGGLVFGKLGDRIGRSKSMACSILTYSLLSGAMVFAQTPLQLAIIWYLASLGFGGMWPNGVALVSEAWSNVSRSFTAGAIGTAANIGIFLFSTFIGYVGRHRDDFSWLVTADGWSWMFLLGAIPAVIGVVSWFIVPESPKWLSAQRRRDADATTSTTPEADSIFRPPLLGITLIGVTLATVPMIGGWGSANFMVPWAEQDGGGVTTAADVSQARSFTGLIGSLLGGWIGVHLGRRLTYFLVSVATLCFAQWTFWFLVPTDRAFLYGVAGLGFFSGIYFGWLPLCLPELYPTRVRSTGAGVCFNFGRILTAATVFGAGALMTFFDGRFERIGRVTSLFFAVGLVAILFAPDTSTKKLDD
jgi:MFS family permease